MEGRTRRDCSIEGNLIILGAVSKNTGKESVVIVDVYILGGGSVAHLWIWKIPVSHAEMGKG